MMALAHYVPVGGHGVGVTPWGYPAATTPVAPHSATSTNVAGTAHTEGSTRPLQPRGGTLPLSLKGVSACARGRCSTPS